jgi:photosystem II stability/assembly factor-like uncharacterized protein
MVKQMKKIYSLLMLIFPLLASGQGEVGYYVGVSGNLFKTVNSGASWSNTFTSTVSTIDFVNESTGYYVSTSGNLFKTTNSGVNWSNTFTSTVQFVDFVNDSTGYYVSSSGNLFKTSDSGMNWSNTFTSTVSMIDFVDDSTGYYVSTSGNLFKTTDSGASWFNTSSSTVQFVDFVNDSTGYYVSTSGNLFKTSNSGMNWSNTFTSTVSMVDFVDDSTGYYVSTTGNLFKTTNSGANWFNTMTSTVQYIDFVSDSASLITYGIDFLTACDSLTWMDGNTYTSSNYTATDTLINNAGYDSIVTLNLTIINIDTSVSQTGSTLSSNNAGATYQWLNCPGMTPINGATNQSYTATSNGDYAVSIAANGCTDTSACYAITRVGMIKNDFGDGLLLYPNPTDGNFQLELGATCKTATIVLTDLNGRLILSRKYDCGTRLNLQLDQPAGVYLLMIESRDKKAVIRLLKL